MADMFAYSSVNTLVMRTEQEMEMEKQAREGWTCCRSLGDELELKVP